MGIFDIFKKKKTNPKHQPEGLSVPKESKVKKSEKEIATEKGEPWVAIVGMDVDPENLHQGAFELDWNEKFVANLVRAGYMMKESDTDAEIVDRWFQNVCRHVVMETWEQEQAINKEYTGNRVVKSRNIGDGRSEVS
jgi:hypothetical protein